MKIRRLDRTIAVALTLAAGLLAAPSAAVPDVVLYASDVRSLQGNWVRAGDGSAAGAQILTTPDNGWSTANSPLASPTYFVDATFDAPANTAYHVWLRLRATASSKYNDSVWVQFSDATDLNGSAIYRMATTSALLVNLENCSGCGVSGWGWQDKAYWLNQVNTVKFATSGTHTIRIQTREDGVQLDQIVLSASTYLSRAPGQVTRDSTIVAKPASAAPPSGGMTPYTGTPAAIPGVIAAANFDNGGEGVAYHDTTAGNLGGAYRSTDVDLERCADGGYDIGWILAGEWVNYTVNVASAGSYTVQLRVASPSGGGSLHLGFNTASNVWMAVAIPATGGWQNWTTVSVPVALGAGRQQMTLSFDSAGFNVGSISVNAASSVTPPSTGTLPSVPTTSATNGAVGVTVAPTLSWQSTGATSFDLRFSASNPPAAFINDLTPVYYEASGLSSGTKYYWQVIAKNAAGSTTGPIWSFTTEGATLPPLPPPPPPPSTGSFTDIVVADWNIQVNDSSVAHAQRVIEALMALSPRPQIIVMEEAYAFHYTDYLNRLAAVTGQTWQGVFQTHCPSGAWNGTCTRGEDEGVAIFSSLPVLGSSVAYLPYADCYHSARAAARLAVSVGGTPLQVFGTHLQTGGCTNVVATRAASMSVLKSWASNYSAPQIAMGDFNAGADEVNTTSGMRPNFVDTWPLVGSGNPYSAFMPNPNMKIDFCFADAGGRAQALWTMIPTSTGTVSDHLPVQTALRIFR